MIMFRECENKQFFLEPSVYCGLIYNPQFSTFYFMFSTVKKHKQQLCLNPLLGHYALGIIALLELQGE